MEIHHGMHGNEVTYNQDSMVPVRDKAQSFLWLFQFHDCERSPVTGVIGAIPENEQR
jgi:hypothetical protein